MFLLLILLNFINDTRCGTGGGLPAPRIIVVIIILPSSSSGITISSIIVALGLAVFVGRALGESGSGGSVFQGFCRCLGPTIVVSTHNKRRQLTVNGYSHSLLYR